MAGYEITKTVESAIATVERISAQPLAPASAEEMTAAGERLVESLLRFKQAAAKLANRPSISTDELRQEAGIEEAKLLSAIEKWQRRFETSEAQCETLERALKGLEAEYGRLQEKYKGLGESLEEEQQRHEKLLKITHDVSTRLGKSIALVDEVLAE